MTVPEQNSAAGFSNISYSAGGFVDRVINKLSPELWGGPYYGNAPSRIKWSLSDFSTYDKNDTFPAYPNVVVYYGSLADISFWEDTSADPRVMNMQNKLLIDYGMYESDDVVLRSVSVSWSIGVQSPYPSNVWVWGRLDEDVELLKYDTPVIGANKVSIGLNYVP